MRPPIVVHLTPNVIEGRIYTRYAPRTSERIKNLGDKVADALRKPKGAVNKQELESLFDEISALGAEGEPLSHQEALNRTGLFLATADRAASEGLMTPQEIAGRKDFFQAAVGAMAISGGGGRVAVSPSLKGPQLPSTRSQLVAIKREQAPPSGQGSGAFVGPRIKYGPFHRLVGREEIELVEKSRQVMGQAPRNYVQSDIPQVKAHAGELPPGRSGYEFYTYTPPDKGAAPGWPRWSGARGEEWHSIDVTVTKVSK